MPTIKLATAPHQWGKSWSLIEEINLRSRRGDRIVLSMGRTSIMVPEGYEVEGQCPGGWDLRTSAGTLVRCKVKRPLIAAP